MQAYTRRMTARRAARLAGSIAVLAGAIAVPVLHAAGRTPPNAAGPLTPVATGPTCFSGPGSPIASCVFEYQLDPAATTDPSVSWHAFWTTTTGPAARRGFCTIQAIETLGWSGPAATRTYPATGTSAVAPRGTARLAVDAAGKATTPGILTQAAGWSAGTVTAATYHGALVVLWQGRTTSAVRATLAAEVTNPGKTGTFVLPPQPSEVGVPCAHLPPPGLGFLARVVPSSVRFGGTAWVQLRIPGTGFQLAAPTKGIRSIAGSATVAYDGGAATPFEVSDRSAIALRTKGGGGLITPGRHTVRVTLKGPSGRRTYRLQLVVR